MSARAIRDALGFDSSEWDGIRDAARDAHMEPREYCRLMVLAAAGFGGAAEHLDRAINASFDIDKRPELKLTVKR
jgi:hypothetical protein